MRTGGAHLKVERRRSDPPGAESGDARGPRLLGGGQLERHPAARGPHRHLHRLRNEEVQGECDGRRATSLQRRGRLADGGPLEHRGNEKRMISTRKLSIIIIIIIIIIIMSLLLLYLLGDHIGFVP